MCCGWVILHVSWCCTLHTAIGCSLSPRVYFILFVYQREVCDRIQLRTWILRYCILLGRITLFSHVLLLAFVNCSIQNGMWRYELVQMVDMEWHVFQWTKIVQTFYGKGPHPLLWAGSQVAHGKLTSCLRHQPNYWGLCPPIGDPCHKRSGMLNRSLGTLQLSWAPLIVNVVSVTVL
jgi:hypothetical protein